jgi:hypothetical protein
MCTNVSSVLIDMSVCTAAAGVHNSSREQTQFEVCSILQFGEEVSGICVCVHRVNR